MGRTFRKGVRIISFGIYCPGDFIKLTQLFMVAVSFFCLQTLLRMVKYPYEVGLLVVS